MNIEYSIITKFVWNQEHTWMRNVLKIVEWCEREILYAAFKYIPLFELWFVKIYALVFIPTLKQLKSNSLLIFLDVIHKKLCFPLYFLVSLHYVIMIIHILVKYHPFYFEDWSGDFFIRSLHLYIPGLRFWHRNLLLYVC